MTTAPLFLNKTLLDAQSQLQTVIAAASEDVAGTKIVEMAFMIADVCILFSETPDRLIEDRAKHLRSALRAMAGIFACLERASVQITANGANKLSDACGECETAIYAFLEETEPDTWGWLK
jgi:hypothetical protein